MENLKIIAGMIVKNEERDLPKALASIESCVDGIVIYDTGSTDNTEQVAKACSKVIHYETYLGASSQDENSKDWKLWDFSKARNKFVEKIEELKADYIFWFDADDILENPQMLRSEIDGNHDVYYIKMRLGQNDWGGHHRIWRTGLGIKFVGKVHEYPTIGNFSTKETSLVIAHDAAPAAGQEDSNIRNLRIIEKEWRENSSNTRTTFYYANTLKDGGQYEPAITIYKHRIAQNGEFKDEVAFSYLYLARCYRATNQPNLAIETCLKAIAQWPNWSEFWMEIAYILEFHKQYEKAIGIAMIAAVNNNEPTPLWREENKYTDQPRRLITRCYDILGDSANAQHWAAEASKLIPAVDSEWHNYIKSLAKPKLALVRPGAYGDILVTLNMLPTLCKHFTVDYYCDMEGLEEILLEAGVHTIRRCSALKQANAVNYDYVVNLIGYPLSEGYPYKPMKQHLLQYFIDEVFAVTGIKCPFTPLELETPNVPISNYITIHATAAWSKYKNWPVENWEKVIAAFPNEKFIQIGSSSDPKITAACHDYMGVPISYSCKLIGGAKLHLGIDSFSNHCTYFKWGDRQIPAIILWGSTQASATGYLHNTNISKQLQCQPCFKENPEISSMPLGPCTFNHECMNSISVIEVINAIWKRLN